LPRNYDFWILRRWMTMPAPADLRNLGRDFEKMLAKLVKAGIQVDFAGGQGVAGEGVDMFMTPMTLCDECGHLTPADACLWCTPAEEDPETIMEDWEFIGEDPIDADAGGHG